MRKIITLVIVFIGVLLLASCGQKITEKDTFLSPNKIVYTLDETVNPDDLTKIKPDVKLSDFDYFSILSNKTSKIVDVSYADVETKRIDDDAFIYEVKVKSLTYKVYLYLEDKALNENKPAIQTISTTFGVSDEEIKTTNTANLFYTPQVNKIDISGGLVLTANFNTTSNDDVLIEDMDDYIIYPEDYDSKILKLSSTNQMEFSFDDYLNSRITFQNKTYKPADNQLPISTKRENNWLGYAWDYALIIPISAVMAFFAGIFFNSYAIGIIFATIIVRTLAWPIYARANDMSMKMALAQPDLNKLQNKYAMKKDPQSQQKMQLEMMQLYKKHGISLLGCFTPILQMPIFLAMFQVVHRITVPGGMFVNQVSHQKMMFGSLDLTASGFNDVWSYVLAIIVGATMWLLQKIASKKPAYAKDTGTQVKSEQAMQSEKTMRTVSTVMIVMMVFASLTSVNALGFYWVIGNTYSIGQSIINRKLQEKKYYKQKHEQSII
ncbi:MAG: YidC/Oxa1 family membrane protein insertase [Acholeplasmataceae bacterium]